MPSRPDSYPLYRLVARLSPSGRIGLSGSYSSKACQSVQTSTGDDDGLSGDSVNIPCVGDSENQIVSDKPGWGGLGSKSMMSRRSSRQVFDRIGAIDCEYPKDKQRFVTLTLAGSTKESYESLARWSSYAANRLNVWLSRLLPNHSRVGVWEYQKRGALHYHAVIGSDDCEKLTDTAIRSVWRDILTDIGAKCGVNMFLSHYGHDWSNDATKPRVEVAVPVKSMGAYLAKYLSKSCSSNYGKKYYPIATWCQWNREATSLFKKHSIETIIGYFPVEVWDIIEGRFYDEIFDARCDNTEILKSGNPYTLGVYGIIDNIKSRDKFDNLCQELKDFCLPCPSRSPRLPSIQEMNLRQTRIGENAIRHENEYRQHKAKFDAMQRHKYLITRSRLFIASMQLLNPPPVAYMQTNLWGGFWYQYP